MTISRTKSKQSFLPRTAPLISRNNDHQLVATCASYCSYLTTVSLHLLLYSCTTHALHVIHAHSDYMRNLRLLFRAFVNKDLKSNQIKYSIIAAGTHHVVHGRHDTQYLMHSIWSSVTQLQATRMESGQELQRHAPNVSIIYSQQYKTYSSMNTCTVHLNRIN